MENFKFYIFLIFVIVLFESIAQYHIKQSKIKYDKGPELSVLLPIIPLYILAEKAIQNNTNPKTSNPITSVG